MNYKELKAFNMWNVLALIGYYFDGEPIQQCTRQY